MRTLVVVTVLALWIAAQHSPPETTSDNVKFDHLGEAIIEVNVLVRKPQKFNFNNCHDAIVREFLQSRCFSNRTNDSRDPIREIAKTCRSVLGHVPEITELFLRGNMTGVVINVFNLDSMANLGMPVRLEEDCTAMKVVLVYYVLEERKCRVYKVYYNGNAAVKVPEHVAVDEDGTMHAVKCNSEETHTKFACHTIPSSCALPSFEGCTGDDEPGPFEVSILFVSILVIVFSVLFCTTRMFMQ